MNSGPETRAQALEPIRRGSDRMGGARDLVRRQRERAHDGREGRFLPPGGADDWDAVTIVRYRSRHDLLHIANALAKKDADQHKWASFEKTQLFPVCPTRPSRVASRRARPTASGEHHRLLDLSPYGLCSRLSIPLLRSTR